MLVTRFCKECGKPAAVRTFNSKTGEAGSFYPYCPECLRASNKAGVCLLICWGLFWLVLVALAFGLSLLK